MREADERAAREAAEAATQAALAAGPAAARVVEATEAEMTTPPHGNPLQEQITAEAPAEAAPARLNRLS